MKEMKRFNNGRQQLAWNNVSLEQSALNHLTPSPTPSSPTTGSARACTIPFPLLSTRPFLTRAPWFLPTAISKFLSFEAVGIPTGSGNARADDLREFDGTK